MTENTEELRRMFSVEFRNELAKFHQQLTLEEQISPLKTIENKPLKKELAKSCLQIIELAEKEEIPIKSTACLLGGFPFYEYGDSLDEVFTLLHEIDMQDEKCNEAWRKVQLEKAKHIFVNYIETE